ncbi:MAG: cobalamin-dependent protein [Candidatus Methanomethylicia archaeon]
MNEKFEKIKEQLINGIVSLDNEAVRKAAQEAIEVRMNPVDVLRALAEGMKIVGKKWSELEFFMPEVLVAADAFYTGMEIIEPILIAKKSENVFTGTMVIGTIFGDIHTIGKSVAKAIFTAELGLRVIDLGVDVPPTKFVEAIKEYNADIVGLGTYMSETFYNIPKVIETLKNAGLRDKVVIVCGGPAVECKKAIELGADGGWNDAWEAVEGIKKLLREKGKW